MSQLKQSAMSNPDLLLVEQHAATLLLTFNRPGAGNALSRELLLAIDSALNSAQDNPALRCIVMTGHGDKFFAAGGDIKQYRALDDALKLRSSFTIPRRLLDRIETLPMPVVAAINGYALGGGAELALACDIRLMDDSAQLGFPFAGLSLMAGWHGTERLVRLCGHASAQWLLLTGERVSAHRALQLGLVHEVVNRGEVRTRALALAEQLAGNAPLSAGAIKRSLRAVADRDFAAARAAADAEFEALWLSEDHREAERAFVEKRSAKFQGR